MLVITRDAVILIGTGVLHFLIGKANVRPSWTGKLATAFQMVAIAGVLLQFHFMELSVTGAFFVRQSIASISILDMLVCIAGFFTLVSGIGYVMDGIRQLQAGGHAS